MAGLVVSRKQGESLMIGDEIKVTVVRIRGDQVRLSFQAPSHVPIHRQEIYKGIAERQNNADGDAD